MYQKRAKTDILSVFIYTLTTLVGLFAFLYPLIFPALTNTVINIQPRAADMPLMMTLLLGICFIILLYEVQGQVVDAKLIALLGLLVSINAALRFLEVAIPGPGGFSPIFFLIVLTGYVFGGRFGFLMGSMTLLISALITGGVGPWLPGQMFAAGWVGMSAPVCRPVFRLVGGKSNFREVLLLALFSGIWGFLYGVFLNLWSWPYITGPANQFWESGITWLETIKRYSVYYMITSAAWDLARSVGNFVFILLFGEPVLRALRRFKKKFSYTYDIPQSDLADKTSQGKQE